MTDDARAGSGPPTARLASRLLVVDAAMSAGRRPCRTRRAGRRPRSSVAWSNSATIRPPRMTSTRWASPSTSSCSDEISRTAMPVGGERVDQLVDRALRADVDSPRRLVGDEDARAAKQPLREQHLLLVSARERVTIALGDGWSPARRRAASARRGAPLAAAARMTPSVETSPRCGSVMLSTIERSISSPCPLRSSGSITTPSLIAWRGERSRTGSPATSIVPPASAVGPEDRAGHLGPAAADQARRARRSRRRGPRTRRR